MIEAQDAGKPPFALAVTPQVDEFRDLHSWLTLAGEGMRSDLNRAIVLDRIHFQTALDQRSPDAIVPGAAPELLDALAVIRAGASAIVKARMRVAVPSRERESDLTKACSFHL